MPDADWQAIKLEYITGTMGYRALAKEHDVSQSTLERHARDEHWPDERRRYKGKVTANALARAGAKEVNRLARLQKSSDRMCRRLEKLMKDAEKELYTHVAVVGTGKGRTELIAKKLEAVDDKKLLNISRAMDVMTRVTRNLYDIQTIGEREQLKIAREELAIKRRAEKTKQEKDIGAQKIEIVLPDKVREYVE